MFARIQLGLGNAMSSLFQMERDQQVRSMMLILIMTFLMDLASNALYDALNLPFWVSPLILVLVLVGAILWFSWRTAKPVVVAPPTEVADLPGFPGLIVFLSLFNARGDQQATGSRALTWRRKELEAALAADVVDWPTVIERFTHSNMQPVLAAMEYHLARGTLQHVWLISTRDVGREDAVIQEGSHRLAPLFKRVVLEGLKWDVKIHDEDPALVVAPHDTTGTYKAVEYVFAHGAHQVGLDAAHVIADFTGGRAPMTAGMVLACAPRDWAMQYTTTVRDPARGGPTDQPVPIGIDVQADDLLLCALDAMRRRVHAPSS